MIGRRIGHYQLEGALGAGGMGEVYRARDLALGRTVALKLLPAGFDPGLKRRLLREAEACGRLQHPAIASLIEAGEIEGTSFIAMELVPGENLRKHLAAGPLPLPEALGIAACALEALGHAHAAGIVHRDIKPENIAVMGPRRAKLLDFGLARSVDAGDADGPTRSVLTEAGTVLGSFGYMAPEQIRGEPADPRTDLFAVGAVLYEMLSGRPAFPGDTLTARIASTLTTEPVPLGGIPFALNSVLKRAMCKSREERYPTARQFLTDLVIASEGEAVSGMPDTLAVLDFENLSGDQGDAWIGSATAETLIADLARTGTLKPIARAAVLRARASEGPETDSLHLGLLLGCRWILQGSYQKVGQALRMVMTVLEVNTGRTVASEKLNGAMEGLFEMQDRVAELAAAALRVHGTSPAAPSRVRPDLDAYECHARGREEWLSMEKARFDRAADFFQEAIEREPGYADALVGLAMVHDMRFTFMTDPAELELAVDYARRAIAVSPGHGEAHIWLAYALWRQGRPEEAYEIASRAGVLDPDNCYPPYFSACMLAQLRRETEALPLFQKAVALQPGFGFAWVGLGNAHMEIGSFDEALWCLRKAVEMETKGRHATAGASGFIAECLRRQGSAAEARQEAIQGLEAAERTDHMYRDTFRGICLNALGRAALDQGDGVAAAAAFRQAETHLKGRTHTLGGGFLLCQALAGRAAAASPEEQPAAERGGSSAEQAAFEEQGSTRDSQGEGSRTLVTPASSVGPEPSSANRGESTRMTLLEEALDQFERRSALDWSWFWLCTPRLTADDLRRAARALDRPDLESRLVL